ncbi:hypothetical protein Lalb_Chr18g0051621 [Lupinus albus]|uniref:DUF1977 domain-containing protein n=1 Tax=Lupinus albus TaxID=3870 RepID=A0A6A4P236_LUPAL|nr:hypothetical protein Lalb_Chr18g0051621 [Lupinus albus]
MDGNKDEALRCFRIAEEAIAIGNKDRALKFIKIAQRLNHNLPLDSLLNQCHRLNSQSSSITNRATATTSAANEGLNALAIPKTTEEYGVQYFVKSQSFDANYPSGSPARSKIEDNAIMDYRNMLHRYCQKEMQRRIWNRNLPTPHCEKLKSFGVASA